MTASGGVSSNDFYDALAAVYHLVYEDWDAAIRRQALALDAVIREVVGVDARLVYDVACGIGTQSLGLAALGYAVTGSDASAGAVQRARREAARRGLAIEFFVADMREARVGEAKTFDVVLCADNSLAHLVDDPDALLALRQMHAATRDGGVAIVTVRDYDRETRGGSVMKPYGVRNVEGRRYAVFQTWEWQDDRYDLSLFVVEDEGGPKCTTSVFRTTCVARPVERVRALMQAAGFARVERKDDAFYQPVLIGYREGA